MDKTDDIDITNWWMVGANGRGAVSLVNPPLALSRENALVLAAWLVAVADRDDQFAAILNRVRNA